MIRPSYQVFPGGNSGIAPPGVALTNFFTNFPATENPISQAGAWTNASIMAAGAATKKNVQTNGAEAYGTMVSFDGTNFTDAGACLTSPFSANQEVTCTLLNNSAPFGLETEIFLHTDFTAAHIFTYEFDLVLSSKEVILTLWNMTVASPNAFTTLRAGVGGEIPMTDGDQYYASAVGTVLTFKFKPVGSGSFSTLFTYDTAGDAVKFSSGRPGVGFWNETGVAGNQPLLGWKDFLANGL